MTRQLQEINEMLSNVMTADDEDAVQHELAQLQAEVAPPVQDPHIRLPNAPEQEPLEPYGSSLFVASSLFKT
jgi:charged multivesicular body protein 6